MSFLRVVHVLVGCLSLLVFWSAALRTSRDAVHRTLGTAFAISMAIVSATAVVLATALFATNPDRAWFFLFLALLTFSPVSDAWRAAHGKAQQRVLFYVLIASGLAIALYGRAAPPLLAMGLVGVGAGIGQLRARDARGRHASGMIAGGIAAHTAPIVTFTGAVTHGWLLWVLPAIVGSSAIAFLNARRVIRQRRAANAT